MEAFDEEFYLATLRTARSVGMSIIPKWKCAMLMAIVYVFGNNEGFTMSPKFKCDRIYIQETYHINGGETPADSEFLGMLKEFIESFEAVKDSSDPLFVDAAKLIQDRYNFKLLC